MDWAQVLVIMLAGLLAIFLILSITLAVLLIKITRQIKTATDSAEKTIVAFGDSVKTFNKAALPMMVAKAVFNQFTKSSKKK